MNSGFRWSAGAGELTGAILRMATPNRIIFQDPSEGYLDYARSSITDPRVDFRVGTDQDVRSLGLAADAVVSGLVLNFVPDAVGALRAAAEVTATRGLIGAYVWDYGDQMALLRHVGSARAALVSSLKSSEHQRTGVA